MMRWGDVAVAAMSACYAVGPDAEVAPDDLVDLIRQINETVGDMRDTRPAAKPAPSKC